MPKKTYTVERETLFTLDEIRTLFKEAHAHCKDKIPKEYHRIGQKRQRPVIARSKSEYQKCIKEYIESKVNERKPKPRTS